MEFLDIISNNNKVQEQAAAVNVPAKQSQRTKQGLTNLSELLEISDDNLSPDPSFDNDVDFCPNNALFNSNNTFWLNNSSYNNASYALPASFHKMTNIHQICLWLCANPDVLLFAYNMYISMQTPVANGFNFISSNFNSSTMVDGNWCNTNAKARR
ncbi:hypothetical protein C1645_816077 [Glomus cerebriforme]|uniref:Uncharacterized protein n=1 Tax=Glomus cerebriforme TaxID=658196 RepID=A0A397TM43_9GLOM|nr:hypothetical protein C1645_816077 [Glomus cerebriforme]